MTTVNLIPLCVPFARKDEARHAGARWQSEQRIWVCDRALLNSDVYEQLRPFVPRMYRPDLKPPYIRPWMVPQTLWGKNLRALLPKESWDIVRRHAYEQAGNRCRVCGGRGPQWPVEADEAWEYDDATRTQTLKGVIALCPDCHRIRHWGKSMVDGREEETLHHLMVINGWTLTQAKHATEVAMAQWEERSRYDWKSDYSWVTRVHGFVPDETGLARAEAANRELVTVARQRVAETEQSFVDSMPKPRLRPVLPDPTPSPERSSKRSIIGMLKSLFR